MSSADKAKRAKSYGRNVTCGLSRAAGLDQTQITARIFPRFAKFLMIDSIGITMHLLAKPLFQQSCGAVNARQLKSVWDHAREGEAPAEPRPGARLGRSLASQPIKAKS